MCGAYTENLPRFEFQDKVLELDSEIDDLIEEINEDVAESERMLSERKPANTKVEAEGKAKRPARKRQLVINEHR